MKAYAVVFLFCVAVSCRSDAQNSAINTSSRLFHSCQDSVRFMDNPQSPVEGSEYCLGYFSGFTDMLTMSPSPGICVADARIGTLIRVYVAYMEKNPQHLDDHEILGVALAMKEPYSCTAKKPD